ncbi:MAG: hypothetical protein IJZ73_01880 [Clostridia bacterium]|nr:hypothetical protein [Clostridia bacterium]
MKKLIALILSVLSLATCFAFSGCKAPTPQTLTFVAPDGAPALAIAQMIKENATFETGKTVNYKIVKPADIGAQMMTGSADIMIMPVNAASKLYKANTSDPYKMAGVVTHGNLYVLSKTPLTVNDLKDKVVGVISQGAVPDLTFRAVLNKTQIAYETSDTIVANKVAIKYYGDASNLVPALRTEEIEIGLLPEPAASKLQKLNTAYQYRLDVQQLYNGTTSAYPQAVLMIKSSVLSAHPEIVNNIVNWLVANATWIKTNTVDAVNAVSSAVVEGVTPSLSANDITSSVIDNCKIYWQPAYDAKEEVINYLADFRALAPQSAGAVADDFFIL